MIFPWSDGWSIEGEKAYFIDALKSALYEVDFIRKEISPIIVLPCNGEGFRNYASCKRIGDEIYCFPGYSKEICVYSLFDNKFSMIPVCDSDTSCIYNSWVRDGLVYC